jgi:aldose 1-epimerase
LNFEPVKIEAQAEQAVIVPGAGFQCLSYRIGSLDIVVGPKDPVVEWQQHPFQTGIPILFPWPGRIADGRFSYGGRELQFPINDPHHNCAIHGLTYSRSFAVTKRGPYYVGGILDSRSDADLSRTWPFPFLLELEYEIGDGLRLRAAVTNVGDAPMPFGLGAHPYFHAPLDPGGTRGAMQIQGSVDRRWQTTDDRLLPTGKLENLAGKFELRQPVTLATNNYDDPFTLDAGRGARAARLIDPKLKMALELRAAPAFRELVIYAPPGREVVALEPYTCAPDAFNLAARSVDAGMLELQAGVRFEASFEIRLVAL